MPPAYPVRVGHVVCLWWPPVASIEAEKGGRGGGGVGGRGEGAAATATTATITHTTTGNPDMYRCSGNHGLRMEHTKLQFEHQ
jgi:hypothetical protein